MPGVLPVLRTTDGLRLSPSQCASVVHYFTYLEAVAKGVIDRVPEPVEAPAANVLQFPPGSRSRRPSTTSGGGDAA